MRHEVLEELPELVEAGVLTPAQAAELAREARGEVVSVHGELRALLYAGVLLVAAGAGLLIRERFDQIGPLAIALGLGAAALGCLAWVVRRAPPFSWQSVPSPDLAFDYVLLLGVLLAASDLAFVEWQFRPSRELWTWHFLVVALGAGFAAFRYDSRVVLSVALSSFAAWRGVSASGIARGQDFDALDVRWNAIACGALFVALAAVLERFDRKRHFEPVMAFTGWMLVLGALASGIEEWRGGTDGWAWALLVVGGCLALWSYRHRRFGRFALGTLSFFVGAVNRLDLLRVTTGGCVGIAILALGLVALLVVAHRRLREERP
jgi:hypothetical protein